MFSCTRWRSDLTSFSGRKQDVDVYPGISNKSPSRRKAHETSPEVCQSEQTVLSSGAVALSRLPETITAGGDLDGAHGDHAGRGHQTGPRGLPLSRHTMCGISADLSQCEGRCPAVTVVYVWSGIRAEGGDGCAWASTRRGMKFITS